MSDLYEELGIPKDAQLDQIRKAYKKRALQTHPDRLPPTATPADKAASEEKFRRVNNAYEVLSDPKKRAEYDIHGVWPPPEVEEIPSRPSGSHHNSFYRGSYPSRSQTFPSPFFSHRHSPFSHFEFTDPFVLFDSIFEGSPSGFPRHRHPGYPQPMDPFSHMHRIQTEIESFMDDLDRDPFGTSGFPRFGFGPSIPAIPFNSSSNRGQWVSESYMTSTVNGVTQTIHKRIDSEGNEHITRTFPDGRKVRTINGQEQPPAGYLPPPMPPSTNVSKSRRIPEPSVTRYPSPDTTHPRHVASPSRIDYRESNPPPYSRNPQEYRGDAAPPVADTHRRRFNSEKYYPTNTSPDSRSHEERHRKKRWWQ